MRSPHTFILLPMILCLVVVAANPGAHSKEGDAPRIQNPGFDSELAGTWGNGSKLPVWWSRNGCVSTASIDNAERRFGSGSLHLKSSTGRAPHVYGTTAQAVTIVPKQRYRVSLWARARNLSSDGAVQVIVDSEWKIRPIHLRKGTYGWTRFEGVFSLPTSVAELRILIEDAGEAWLDSLELVPLDPGIGRKAEFADAVQQFRTAAVADFSRAVKDWGSEESAKRLEEMNRLLWPHTEPKTGWSYQINLSLLTAGDLTATRPIAGFYNPWSDVFLVTTWSETPSGFRLNSLEPVMGELVRNRGARAPIPIPGWQCENIYRPAAVPRLAGKSVTAFEQLFGKADGNRWLDGLPLLKDRKVLEELNYRGCALQLANALRRVQDFYVPTKGEPGIFALVRAQTQKFLEQAAQGQVGQALRTSSETQPQSADVLARTPPEGFRGLVTAATSVAGNEAVIFLVSPSNPTGFISLDIDGTPGRTPLKRVDVVSFEAACRASPTSPATQANPRK